MRNGTLAAVAFVAVSAAFGANPPDLVNYQGVLRNASDKPQTGAYDMVFRFFDAATAGNEIMVDAHTGGGNVVVSNGLFNVQLGGGTVTDGAGAGTYTALSQVFRDFGAVWVEIRVGAETLSPRIRVQSAAYALNAANLGGKAAGSYVDTTASSQTKAGHLIAGDGLEGNSGSGVGVQGIGATSGGTFANQAITAVAHLGYNNGADVYGVHGMGTTAGGWFHDPGGNNYALLGKPGYGVYAKGTTAGGSFFDYSTDGISLAAGGYGIFGEGSVAGGYFYDLAGSGSCAVADGSRGLSAYGSSTGGLFTDGSGDSTSVGYSGYGIYATGGYVGGFFGNFASSGTALVGDGGYGVYAYGNVMGATFYDTDNSGTAYIGSGDLGVDGYGLQAGGHFAKPGTNAQSYLAASNGFYQNGVYGLSNGSGECPGYFTDQYSGAYAYVGCFGSKVYGTGGVYFVQNHPQDPAKVIVYAAPEGDEVAVYTRGTARLSGGTARIKLGETFAWVANPDIGLTAQLTPRGLAVPLAVESLSTSELVVRGPAGGPDDLGFDYIVWGLRIGFEDRAVVEPKREEAYIPATTIDDATYVQHPELRAFSARERFAKMEAAAGEPRRSGAAGAELKAAIHVYDRDVDLPKLLAANPTAANAQPIQEHRPERPLVPPPTSQPARPERPPVDRPGVPPVDARALYPPNTIQVDVAERVEAGQVIANDATRPGELRASSIAADPGVVGIVAGDDGTSWSAAAPIAVAGSIVLCDVDASYGPIAPNDLLVTSPTPGHAMRAGDGAKQGTVVAKALQPFASGLGKIRVLVMSR